MPNGTGLRDAFERKALCGRQCTVQLERIVEDRFVRSWPEQPHLCVDSLKGNRVGCGVHPDRHVHAERKRGLEQVVRTEASAATALLNRGITEDLMAPVADESLIGIAAAFRPDHSALRFNNA